MASANVTMTVYGSKISYFTGKFEAYLRYRGLPYDYRGLDLRHYRYTVPRALGATQYPSVRLADGRWMSDTTPMIAWLERQHPGGGLFPEDPVQRYLALLVEDFADEWMWRPAMCIRWTHADDRRVAGTSLAREVVRLPAPLALRRAIVSRRQTQRFVTGDGIDRSTIGHAHGCYTRLLALLEPVFRRRPYLLGERPTVADIGLMGPLWRHFVHDPTPAATMQEHAPAVWEWAARLWNARSVELAARPLPDAVPADLSPLWQEIAATHLEALSVNAAAHGRGASHHDLPVQGVTYRGVPTSAYRVWCLEQLRQRWEELPKTAAEDVRALLDADGAWEPLWRVQCLASGHDPAGKAPFCKALRMVRD